WAFAQRFPYTHRFTRIDRVARAAERLSVAFGAVAFSINVAASRMPALAGAGWAAPFLRANPFGVFWLLFYAGVFPALACIAARCWAAPAVERRPVARFGAALATGIAPIVLAGITQVASPGYRALMTEGHIATRIVDAAVWLGLISLPLTTGYAVFVQGALPVRRVIGAA